MRKITPGLMLMTAVLLVIATALPMGSVYADKSGKKEPPFWWRVELRVYVQGDYRFQRNETGYQGKYSFVTVLLGSMQPDEDDYMFFQAFQDAIKVKWNEKSFGGGGAVNSKWKDYSKTIKPEITLNYVFRERGKLLFDFDIAAVTVPFGDAARGVKEKELILPVSGGDASVQSKASYKRKIINGSNALVLRDHEIYNKDEKTVQHTYQWIWKSKKKGFMTRHKVKAYLKILRLNKETNTKK